MGIFVTCCPRPGDYVCGLGSERRVPVFSVLPRGAVLGDLRITGVLTAGCSVMVGRKCRYSRPLCQGFRVSNNTVHFSFRMCGAGRSISCVFRSLSGVLVSAGVWWCLVEGVLLGLRVSAGYETTYSVYPEGRIPGGGFVSSSLMGVVSGRLSSAF